MMPLLNFSSMKAEGQTQVRILQADRLAGETTEMGRVRKLLNNVVMETDDLHIIADSVYQYLDLDLVDAFGNIQIETDNQIIWSDSLRYNTSTDVSTFNGRVVIQGENAVMFSDEMIYNFFFEIAEFPGRIRLEDADGVLEADRGFYFSIPDSAVFYGNVQVTDQTQYAEADTLYAIRNAQFYELHGNVYLEDFENRSRMRGDFSSSDSTGYRELRRNARLQRINEAETDTTFLQAEWIELTDRDTTSIVDAYENVRIWSERYASISDSARYDDLAELFILGGDARLWREDLQLSAELIEIQLQDDEIERLLATPRAIAVTPDSVTGRFNQITGDSLWIFFEESELQLIEVHPNAEMIIHEKDENDDPEFAIQVASAELFMYFSGSDIDSLKYYRNVDGRYIPEAQDPGSVRLQGFQYNPDLRPERPSEWLIPSLPPVSGEPMFALPRRYLEYLRQREQSSVTESADRAGTTD
ncbi:MAG: hypothetical protein LAT84_00750 [Balneolia bacterium]|nr:hypothetical protein [Balneolia bacterium]